MKEKNFDPVSGWGRKLGMLLLNDLSETQDLSPPPTRYEDAVRARHAGHRRVVTSAAQDDAQWVAKVTAIAASQDQAAFADLFRHFAPKVKAFLIKSGADVSLAEECMQDVMATLWRKAHMYDPARASVATWIFTVARNRKIDLLRKYARPEPEDLPWGPEAAPDQAEVIALQQDSARLAEALKNLPEKQRILIERAYFGDLTHSEIAAETGLPLGTIKSRIRLALDRLRHNMT
ncbi:sigma-70 family RNA polymerase sigma factor [Roseobacter sp. HKCCD9010]|nr:sigma-70 family RNA polymerase sigma factor [Rhodobacterales bacterium HKCCD4356]NNV10633.1 sigma-70 family RNA polymerase sigma factor [Roseobacter sp. HKCCD7357]NNV14818.1 sigma-70 family RNA polymerase sigma factor [Roseobacter sp. HKCCD8768]NNV24277.1 sigma-70 family RNA polymerase sigma factor [Roseobacter sp. HKCCD8192]NNV28534.1 sigma-70 family RNA polymerase sigma factor [Roseobacter sp. HKCCD9061]NNV32807.1 sigma-70 family RNA polymerase sigma factor [Roseobacter sp. HKCCD9073]NNV